MSDKKRQKTREKKKAKRATKQKTRRVRNLNAATSTQATSLRTILGWPLGEAWIGQDWHEQGARVPALITRAHPSGGIAAAVFDLDLESDGVVRAALLVGLDDNELHHRLAELSETSPMVETTAGVVLACVEAAAGLDELPAGFADARAMFGELELDGSVEILTGTPPEPKRKKGLFARLFG
ncbi:MAG TPA: hypothetical protein QGF58_29440 [Myxococcota bacterium]|nr:hypothetical protein [Myxococcota bacterium]